MLDEIVVFAYVRKKKSDLRSIAAGTSLEVEAVCEALVALDAKELVDFECGRWRLSEKGELQGITA